MQFTLEKGFEKSSGGPSYPLIVGHLLLDLARSHTCG
jgi:hypothetical protein